MKKREIRQSLAKFFVRPRRKWEQIIWLADRGLQVSAATLISVTAFLTGNAHWLVGILLILLLGLWIIYTFVATGR